MILVTRRNVFLNQTTSRLFGEPTSLLMQGLLLFKKLVGVNFYIEERRRLICGVFTVLYSCDGNTETKSWQFRCGIVSVLCQYHSR